MNNPSASGKMPADNAKFSAPRLSAQSLGWARTISAMRKNVAAVSTIAASRVVPDAMTMARQVVHLLDLREQNE
jgi:hypothetical protein